jgi:hypothetical protein
MLNPLLIIETKNARVKRVVCFSYRKGYERLKRYFWQSSNQKCLAKFI